MVAFVAVTEFALLLFLMNDVVLTLDTRSLTLPIEMSRFRSLTLPFVIQLGQELFAEQPRLQHTDPEKARRLGLLIAAKNPEINAALFVAPTERCPPEEVISRYCQISFDVMGLLLARQEEGSLTTVATDSQVWRRLAA
jgi:hypothetical protein